MVYRHKAMAEICRVLKLGSTVSVLDFNKSINPLSTTIQVVGRLIHFFRIIPNCIKLLVSLSFVLSDVKLFVL